MVKFLKRFADVANYGHCIIKEELMISDSDEEIDVEKLDVTIDSTPKNANFSDSQAEIEFDKHNKSYGRSTSRKSESLKNKNVNADNKKQTTLEFFVKSGNVESNNKQSQNSTDSIINKKSKAHIKTAKYDIDALTEKLAKSYCKKCKKERPVIRRKARCSKCKTQLSYVCHTCDRTYSNFTDLGCHLKCKHMKVHVFHPCTICCKNFTYRKGLLQHRRTVHHSTSTIHNNDRSLQCSNCGKVFSRPVNRTQHENVCNQQTTLYKCDNCSYTTRYKCNLTCHMSEKHSGFKAKCDNCPKIFTNNRSLKNHMKIYCNKPKTLECHHCGHKFYRKDQMVMHLRQFHMIGYYTNSNSDKKFRDTKTCQDCGLTLGRYQQMKTHRLRCKSGLELKSSSTLPKKRTCTLCGMTLVHQERMKHHMIRCKSGLLSVSGPFKKKPRICKYCGETMKRFEHMRYHVERCESAPLALRYTAERAKLPDMDTALTELAILHCVKCKTKEPLSDRVRRCSKCNKLLKFACVSCRKSFADSSHLREHLERVHVRTLKFYRCDKCRCSYNREKNLIVHQRVAHSNKQPTTNYNCKKCGKEYRSKASLRKHMISCSQEPRFYCDKCPYKTHFKSCIIDHIWAKRATCI